MNSEECFLANEIVKKGEARITWVSPGYFIFTIKTSEGEQEVYLRIRNGVNDWSCNVNWTQKDGVKWGCVMIKEVDHSKPYCAHTLSCLILYERWKKEQDELLWKPKKGL